MKIQMPLLPAHHVHHIGPRPQTDWRHTSTFYPRGKLRYSYAGSAHPRSGARGATVDHNRIQLGQRIETFERAKSPINVQHAVGSIVPRYSDRCERNRGRPHPSSGMLVLKCGGLFTCWVARQSGEIGFPTAEHAERRGALKPRRRSRVVRHLRFSRPVSWCFGTSCDPFTSETLC
jgi:hypothetical protein